MKPISFTPEVLRAKLAVLDATGVSQTRRPLTPQPRLTPARGGGKIWTVETRDGFANSDVDGTWPQWMTRGVRDQDGNVYPPVAPWPIGTILYVRERAMVVGAYASIEDDTTRSVTLRYDVDGMERTVAWPSRISWAPVEGRCIPNGVYKEGARHFLEVVDVRVQRVQETSEADARAEGCKPGLEPLLGHGPNGEELVAPVSAKWRFQELISSLYPGSWDENWWMWCYTLTRATSPEPAR